MTEQLTISPVFKALTRPALIMGVDHDYMIYMSLLVVIAFIFSGSILSLLLVVPLYALGWVLCQIDPFIFKLIWVNASVGSTKNKVIWGCQSYAPF